MERGVALVIVLILLVILTMLAIAGAGTATAELAMAGNEQYRKRASDAASAGIEQALARLSLASAASAATAVIAGPTPMPSSATDSYTTTTRYAGEETNLPQSSAEKLIGFHYSIESTGSSLRGAADEQVQGVLMIMPVASVSTFHRLGSGLTGGSGP